MRPTLEALNVIRIASEIKKNVDISKCMQNYLYTKKYKN